MDGCVCGGWDVPRVGAVERTTIDGPFRLASKGKGHGVFKG